MALFRKEKKDEYDREEILKAAEKAWGQAWGSASSMVTRAVTIKAMIRVAFDLAREDGIPVEGRVQRWQQRLKPWADMRPAFKADAAALERVATGRIFTASQALEHGLVDQIGFVEAAIGRAAELAKVDPKNVRCVHYEEPPSLFDGLAGANATLGGRARIDLSGLIDLMTPRAYYLWTWLPAAMSNTR